MFVKRTTFHAFSWGTGDSRCDRDLVPVPLGSSPPTTKMRVSGRRGPKWGHQTCRTLLRKPLPASALYRAVMMNSLSHRRCGLLRQRPTLASGASRWQRLRTMLHCPHRKGGVSSAYARPHNGYFCKPMVLEESSAHEIDTWCQYDRVSGYWVEDDAAC